MVNALRPPARATDWAEALLAAGVAIVWGSAIAWVLWLAEASR